MERARDLARQIERDDYVRKYIEERGFLVALFGTATGISWAVIVWALLSRIALVFAPLGQTLKWTFLVLGLVLWLGLITLFMYALLSKLEQSALQRRAQEQKRSSPPERQDART